MRGQGTPLALGHDSRLEVWAVDAALAGIGMHRCSQRRQVGAIVGRRAWGRKVVRLDATLRAQVEALETQRQQLPFAIEEERRVQLAAARTLAQGDFDGAHARSVSARARSFNSRRHPQGARLSR